MDIMDYIGLLSRSPYGFFMKTHRISFWRNPRFRYDRLTGPAVLVLIRLVLRVRWNLFRPPGLGGRRLLSVWKALWYEGLLWLDSNVLVCFVDYFSIGSNYLVSVFWSRIRSIHVLGPLVQLFDTRGMGLACDIPMWMWATSQDCLYPWFVLVLLKGCLLMWIAKSNYLQLQNILKLDKLYNLYP